MAPTAAGRPACSKLVADMIKIFFKEDWVPPFADKPVFVIAPAIIMVTTLMSFAVIPFAPAGDGRVVVSDLNIGPVVLPGDEFAGRVLHRTVRLVVEQTSTPSLAA